MNLKVNAERQKLEKYILAAISAAYSEVASPKAPPHKTTPVSAGRVVPVVDEGYVSYLLSIYGYVSSSNHCPRKGQRERKKTRN